MKYLSGNGLKYFWLKILNQIAPVEQMANSRSTVKFRNYNSYESKIDDLILSETNNEHQKVKVFLKDSTQTFSVASTVDNVYLDSKDGTSQISQKELNDKLGSLIGKIAVYNSDPTAELNELRKFINIP